MARSVRTKKAKGSVWKPKTQALRDKAISVSRGAFWTPVVGSNRIRVLPPADYKTNEEATFFFDAVLHHGFKDEDAKRRALPCLRYHSDKSEDCPACQAIEWAQGYGTPAQQDLVQNAEGRPRTYYNVILRQSEFPTVQIWGSSAKIRDDILTLMEVPGYEGMLDPEAGNDIILTRTGTGMQTRYRLDPVTSPSPVGLDGWQGKVFDLADRLLVKVTEKEMRAYMKASYDGVLPIAKIFGKKEGK